MHFHIESEQEEDGRWIAEIPEIPGALAYGKDAEEAMAKVEVLALRVLAEQIEVGETCPIAIRIDDVSVSLPRNKTLPRRFHSLSEGNGCASKFIDSA